MEQFSLRADLVISPFTLQQISKPNTD